MLSTSLRLEWQYSAAKSSSSKRWKKETWPANCIQLYYCYSIFVEEPAFGFSKQTTISSSSYHYFCVTSLLASSAPVLLNQIGFFQAQCLKVDCGQNVTGLAFLMVFASFIFSHFCRKLYTCIVTSYDLWLLRVRKRKNWLKLGSVLNFVLPLPWSVFASKSKYLFDKRIKLKRKK